MDKTAQHKRITRRALQCGFICLFLCLSFLYAAPSLIRSFETPFHDNGWWVDFYDPAPDIDSPGYGVFLQAEKEVALNKDFKSAKAYTVWSVAESALYSIRFKALATHGKLLIDGRVVASFSPGQNGVLGGERWVELAKGNHIVQLIINSEQGWGWFQVLAAVPPLMRYHSINPEISVQVQGKDKVRLLVVISALFFYCRLLLICTVVWLCFWGFCFLLPVTVQKHYSAVAVFVFFIFLLPLMLPGSTKREPYIGKSIHTLLEEKQPEFVFIGNSMLWSRIDDNHLESLLQGQRVHSIVNIGGFSSLHYLAFKYLLLPARITPKRVFIFFRRNTLTVPRLRARDAFAIPIVERMTPGKDALYDKIVFGHTMTWGEIVYQGVEKIFPVLQSALQARQTVSNIAARMALYFMEEQEDSQILALVNKRFSFLEGDLKAGEDLEAQQIQVDVTEFDFYKNIEGSFLPHIIEMAREHNIPLAIIRVQTRPGENGMPPEPPAMKQYLEDLQKYLSENDVFYYDFSGDPELPLAMYRDGDHIKDQKAYSELFYQRLGHILK